MKKNKAIIIQHSGGELANQLWTYISIYSYCLERNLDCFNPCFYEYAKYFKHPKTGSLLIDTFFTFPYKFIEKRRTSLVTKFFRFAYKMYFLAKRTLNKNRFITTRKGTREFVTYLPPTEESKTINQLSRTGNTFFDGWLFRNPKGIQKYHKDIVAYFAPNKKIQDRVREIMIPLRNDYEMLIGVHIRQSDYRGFKRGKYFVDQGRIRTILDEFLSTYKIDKEKVVFFIASDGPIENDFFKGLNTYVSGESAPVDLFALSSTDAIIGSDSTFSDFSAYYGDIPHIVCTHEDIDWEYYRDKEGFFANKYSTMVHY